MNCVQFATEGGHISTLRRPGDTYDLRHELGKLPTNLCQMNGQMNGQHTPLLQSSSLEDWGSPETPFSLPNTECRVLGWKHEDLGILGTREVLDAWHWPEELDHSLFTASRRGNRKVNRGKDVMASALRDVRMTCRISYIPDARDLWIRHCSGRPRCIHELKQHNAEQEVGQNFACITDDRVYQNYGRLSAQQAGKKLTQNHQFWKGMYVPEAPWGSQYYLPTTCK